MKKFYVTTPIYYVNSAPHIGSAYTTIAADVLARFHRFSGLPTFFLVGTAEHGTKIQQSAEQSGKPVHEFVRENSAKFSLAWDTLNIAPDDFIRTTESRHERAVIKFFKKLEASGKIYEGEYEGRYCVGHEAFLKETDLDASGKCPDHGTKPELIKEKNWFFPLSEYADLLKKRIKSREFVIEPESRRNEILSFLDQGLEDITISRQHVKWAIPLPWDKNQTIYVWLDELFNYCSALGYPDGENYKKFWPADLHLIGKDIIRFHCVIWPALLEAAGIAWPKKVFAHGFFTIDGQKISKSLGNIIDPVELAQKFTPDGVRYFLLREIPFGEDGDFSLEKLRSRYESDLSNGLGNFASRVTALSEQFGVAMGPYDDAVKDKIRQTGEIVVEKTSNLRFHEALSQIWDLIAFGDVYINENKLWLKRGDNVKHIAGMLAILDKLAFLLAPYMPGTAEKIRIALSAEKIQKLPPLFPRLG